MKQTTSTAAPREVAVLGFVRKDVQATVVTDGQNVRSFEASGCKSHRTLGRAIAYLESRGYNILMDTWT
jgi:hypothetical protein